MISRTTARGDLGQRRERARELLVEQVEQVEVDEHHAPRGGGLGDRLRGLCSNRATEHRDPLEALRGVEDRARVRQRLVGRSQQRLVAEPGTRARLDDRLVVHRHRHETAVQPLLEIAKLLRRFAGLVQLVRIGPDRERRTRWRGRRLGGFQNRRGGRKRTRLGAAVRRHELYCYSYALDVANIQARVLMQFFAQIGASCALAEAA